MPLHLLFCWLMVSLRALGIVLLFPTLGGSQLPVTLRLGISFLLATLLYGIVPHSLEVPMNLYGLGIAIGGEVLLGLAMGFVGRLVFSTVEVAGRLITQEIGLSGIPGIDAPRPGQEPLASLVTMFAGLLFFLSGAHMGALAAFNRSFEYAAAGKGVFGVAAGQTLIVATANVIEVGFRIAAPFIAMNFLINLAFSVLGRAVPKTNVFVLSFSLRSIVGLMLLASSGVLIARYLWIEFDRLPARMLELLPRL